MKIKFSIKHEVRKPEVFKKLKKVLFDSMLKLNELAVNNVPVDTGLLKERINLLPAVPGYASYTLTAGTDYAAAVEFGTGPHIIKPVKKKALKFEMEGKEIVVKKVMHPGTEAQPYFRPALDQVKGVWIKKYWDQTFK